MKDPTDIFWLLGELAIVAMAIWLVLRTLFTRRARAPAKRGSHIGDGVICLVVALSWAGLCGLVCFGAAFAGAPTAFFVAVLVVGGGVCLVLLWGSGRHFVQAFRRSANPKPDGSDDAS